MGVLQEIYKKYTHLYRPDDISSDLDIIRKLILSNAFNDYLEVKNRCSVEYIDKDNRKHIYTCYVMDDEFKSTVPKNSDTYDFFRRKYILRGQCHSVTASYLEKNQHPKFRAVTSLCYGSNSCFFHSYIWDTVENYIYDFSRNIIMKKEQFDEIFVYKQINVLSYEEYINNLRHYEYMLCGEDYCRLMYLALIKLYEEEMNADLPECEYPREYVGNCDFLGTIGRACNRH